MYVALDLSLPSMPGAFVFDPGDSVESLQGNRARTPVEVVPLRAAVDESFAASQSCAVDNDRLLLPVDHTMRRPDRGVLRAPRADLDSAPASEDPFQLPAA